MKRLIRVVLTGVMLALTTMPVIPQQSTKAALSYPILPDGLNYYKTTFPTGLIYSQGWYGTFTNAPKATVLLFDDDYSSDFGIAVFAVPPAPSKQPSGEQGGTTLTAITKQQASDIIQSYNLTASVKPFDAEIEAVMPMQAYFTGIWAGDKLQQKWKYGSAGNMPPPELQTQRQKDYLTDISGKPIKSVDLSKYDPDRFWVGGSGNWSDTNHWSAATGGAPGASVPTNADNTFFDANSFTGAGQIVTVDVVANVLTMNWTGVTNNPTLRNLGNVNQSIKAYGNVLFSPNMTVTKSGNQYVIDAQASLTLTTNGVSLGTTYGSQGSLICASGTVTLADNLNGGLVVMTTGNINTNGKTVNAYDFNHGGSAGTRTITLGNSTLNIFHNFGFSATGTTIINANTASVSLLDSASFTGGSRSYNGTSLYMNGTSHTVSGNNTYNVFGSNSSQTQTITFSGNTVHTASSFNLGGSSGHQHTLQSSNATNWTISVLSGNVTADYITVSRSTANTSGGQEYFAVGGSVDGGNNSGWQFPLTILTGAISNLTIDKDGITSGNFTGTITDMGGQTTVNTWHEYGLTAAYGSNTANITYTTTNFTGIKYQSVPNNLVLGSTYHSRYAITSGSNTTYGGDVSDVLIPPAVATVVGSSIGTTATLQGNLSSLGSLTSVYKYFEWGYDTSYPNSTALITGTTTGLFSTTVTFDTLKIVHYRAVLQVGSNKIVGDDQTIQSGVIPNGGNLFLTIIPMILAVVAIGAVIKISTGQSFDIGLLLKTTTVGLIVYVVVTLVLNVLF